MLGTCQVPSMEGKGKAEKKGSITHCCSTGPCLWEGMCKVARAWGLVGRVLQEGAVRDASSHLVIGICSIHIGCTELNGQSLETCPSVHKYTASCYIALILSFLAKSKYENFLFHGLTGQDMQLNMESSPI